ncbi:MAG: hypothetical protein RLP44_04025 [Aggregatilineales bacterium]
MRVTIFWRFAVSFILSTLCLSLVIAQDEDTTTPITIRQTTSLYSGPGITYREIGELDGDESLDLLARNRIGNWVELRVIGSEENSLEGWALTGTLSLAESIHFSDTPIDETLTDAAPYNLDDDLLARMYSVPVIPQISDDMRMVYALGQSLGNRSETITKIGDSLSVSSIYLTPMWRTDHRLGAYDYLADPIAYFGESTRHESVASRIGLNTSSIFDPMWADQVLCNADESPLLCEYRLTRPSIAFIMFGPNDVVSNMTVEGYESQMRVLVEITLDVGIIPVLSTFSTHPQSRWWDKSMAFNLALVDIAADYDVPIMNLWSAARALPNYGLAGDNIHMMHGTYEYFNFTTGHEATVGISLQNLVSLATLYELYTFLEME